MTVNLFLDKYKELEGILRNSDAHQTILQYEETLLPDDMERLRICRQIRNYIQHHEDGLSFLTATNSMIAFIENLIKSENAKKECVKDRLYRLSPLLISDTLSDIIQKFSKTKRDWLPITDENGVFVNIIDAKNLITILAEYKTSTKLKKVLSENKLKNSIETYTLEKEIPLENYYNKNIIVIGSNNKYLGIVKW